MNILEQYLQYLNEQNTAFAKKIRQGKLSPQAIEKLKSMGVIKPWQQYAQGMEKGFETSTKKTGTEFKYDPNIQGGRYDPDKNLISVNPYDKEREIMKKHEASEASQVKKVKKKYKEYGRNLTLGTNFNNKEGENIGIHVSPSVLRGEKKLTDFINPVYGTATNIKNYRKQSGEEEYITKTTKAKQRKQHNKAMMAAIKNNKVLFTTTENKKQELQDLYKHVA